MSEIGASSEQSAYSPLAWEIARRAEFRAGTKGSNVEAAVVVSNATLVTGRGATTTEAMRDLAQMLDKWARSDYGGL